MTWLLNILFGLADHCVIVEDGFYFAIPQSRVVDGDDVVVAATLRRGAAVRKARRLRQQAEDQPRVVL